MVVTGNSSSAGTIKMASIPPPPASHQVSMWPPRAPVRVLLLLDHECALVRLVELTLSHAAYAVHNSSTWAEADIALETWQPHLALVDMRTGGGHAC
jgi:hypothetical protein